MGILSREEEVLDDVAGDAVTAELVQADAETAPAGDEVVALQGEITEGLAATDDLEKVGDAVAATLEEGGEGLNEQAAEITEVSVESIMYRLGGRSPVVSTESFKSATSRRQATVLTLQGIMSTVKKAWEKLKQLLASLWEKFRTWISSVIGFVKVGRDTAAKLVARLQKKRGAKKSSEKISGKSYVAFFSEGGKADLGTVKAGIENALKNVQVVGGSFDNLGNFVGAAKSEVIDLINKAAKGESVSIGEGEVPGALEAYNKFAQKLGELKLGRGITAKLNVESVNGKPKAKFEVKLPQKFEPAKEIDVAEISDLISVCADLQKLAELISLCGDEKKFVGGLKSQLTRATDEILNIVSAAEKKEDAADADTKKATAAAAKFASSARELFFAAESVANDVSHKVITYAKEALREGLLYVAAAEAAYKLED